MKLRQIPLFARQLAVLHQVTHVGGTSCPGRFIGRFQRHGDVIIGVQVRRHIRKYFADSHGFDVRTYRAADRIVAGHVGRERQRLIGG